jgi:hypothetical protein
MKIRDPKAYIKYINESFRKKESIKLYREILKTTKLFTCKIAKFN